MEEIIEINIKGKHNVNAFNKLKNKKSKRISNNDLSEKDKEVLFNYNNFLVFLGKLYLNDNVFEYKKYILSEFKKKIYGYKAQDIKKKREITNDFITMDNLIEKLLLSKLKCYYCKKNVKLLFDDVRDNEQWTLDRINNDICHTNENTVICDLRCNIQRRLKDDKQFLNDKQLKITLIE